MPEAAGSHSNIITLFFAIIGKTAWLFTLMSLRMGLNYLYNKSKSLTIIFEVLLMIGTIIFVISIVESALEPIPICYPSNHGGPGDLLG